MIKMRLTKNTIEQFSIGLLIATIFIIVFNAYQIYQLKNIETGKEGIVQNTQESQFTQSSSLSSDILPKGMPAIYGKELGVSYDDVSITNVQKSDSTIKKLGVLDQQISLSGTELQRYIDIASQISCEYCCGVDSIIFNDGKPACGCAHSFAMRGLAKYLIKNHGNEYSNDAILEELSKWKILFFPSQLAKKAQILKEKGIDTNYINLASNKYRGAENGK